MAKVPLVKIPEVKIPKKTTPEPKLFEEIVALVEVSKKEPEFCADISQSLTQIKNKLTSESSF